MTGEPIEVRVDADIADLVPDYLSNRRHDVASLRSMIALRDFEGIRRIAHQIKGSGASYGFDKLSDAGRDLENAARVFDSDRAAEMIDRIASYLRDVKVIAV